jgi:hypothetical protein
MTRPDPPRTTSPTGGTTTNTLTAITRISPVLFGSLLVSGLADRGVGEVLRTSVKTFPEICG